MIRFDKPAASAEDERILPLVNVVFLLLIFVMIAGEVISPDPLQTDPPYSAREGGTGTPETTVYLGVDFQIALGDMLVTEAMLAMLLHEKERLGTVRLKADGRVPASRVVTIMELLASSGIREVELVTVSEVPK
ncbi:MAG: biopolymer transporter ExbD [Gammaproteobacteria bacterium]|nr:biopolymer transporter ExbD [Gammaproteobacteria bacterium]MCY4227372.1 biopolymer transporter ExbD [Gammaproteobacteria bacterium]